MAAHELLAAAVSAPARPGRPYESAARAALRLIPGWGDPREANRLGAVAEHLCVTPQALARMSLDEARYVAELLCELDTPSNVRAFAVTCTPASDDHAAPGRSPVLAAAS